MPPTAVILPHPSCVRQLWKLRIFGAFLTFSAQIPCLPAYNTYNRDDRAATGQAVLAVVRFSQPFDTIRAEREIERIQ